MKVDDVMLGLYIARENVALTATPSPTAVAPAAGLADDTVGGEGAVAAVVNVHETAPASAMPLVPVIAGESVAV